MGNLIGKKPNTMSSGPKKKWGDVGIWEHPLPETEENYDPQNEKWRKHLKRITRYNKLFKRLRKKV